MAVRRLIMRLAVLGLTAAAPPAARPYSRMDLPWWRERFAEKQAELRRGPVELLWLGDSITQDFEVAGPEPWRDFAPAWRHFTDGRGAVNLGFKGDATAHLLWRIEHGETDGIAPRAAVVLIGANNFGHLHWDAADSFAGVVAVIDALRQRLPGTRILLLGVLPSIRSEWVDRNTAALNAMLERRYGHDDAVTWRDLRPLFLTDGRVDRTRFLDIHLTPPDPPLHPDAATAARMLAAIEPDIARLLGDRPRPPFGGG